MNEPLLNEPLLTGIIISSCGALVVALAIMIRSMFIDLTRKVAEIAIQTNDNTNRIEVQDERIATNRAKIDRTERLMESDFAERQAELIISKIRVMGYNGNGK